MLGKWLEITGNNMFDLNSLILHTTLGVLKESHYSVISEPPEISKEPFTSDQDTLGIRTARRVVAKVPSKNAEESYTTTILILDEPEASNARNPRVKVACTCTHFRMHLAESLQASGNLAIKYDNPEYQNAPPDEGKLENFSKDPGLCSHLYSLVRYLQDSDQM